MKKLFLLCAVVLLSFGASAQKGQMAIGGNLVFGSGESNLGLGLKFNYGITDQIRFSPSFNYFFPSNNVSAFELNADFHYLFPIADKLTVYPLAGVSYSSWHYSGGLGNGSSSTGRFGVNLGGGIQYALTQSIDLGAELKYAIISNHGQFVPSLNIMFKF